MWRFRDVGSSENLVGGATSISRQIICYYFFLQRSVGVLAPLAHPTSDGPGIVVCQSAWNGPIKSADKKAIWRSLSTSVYLMVYLHIFSDIESWKTKKCRGRCFFFLLGLRRYLYNYLLFKSSNGVVYGSSRPCATRWYFINDLEKKFHFTYLFTLLYSPCTVWPVYPVWNFVAILNSIVTQ